MHINIEKVSHQYETKQGMLPVLKDLSLSIKRKGFTAIVGPSGCGKSTITRLVSGLIKPTQGSIFISNKKITVNGSIAPGPDYKLYLTSEFTQHEDEFLPIKDKAKYVAEVKNFENFVVDVPSNIDVSKYNTVVIWCESFSEFITAAKYQ